MVITFIVSFVLFGGIALIVMYETPNEKIYKEVEYIFDNFKSPADELKVGDFKSVQQYAKKSQEMQKLYEDTVFEELGKKHNKTGEEIKKIYIEEFEKHLK